MTNRSRTGARVGLAVLSVLVLCLLSAVTAFGQAETGQLTVKVTDVNGAVIVGATVTAKSVATGALRAATTPDAGLAVMSNLAAGQYDVTVNAKGFAEQTKRVEVTVGGRLEVDIAMGAQALQEAVTVVAGQGGVEVNTQSQELSDVISSKQVQELPSLTRNPYDFVVLSGNVSSDPSGSTPEGVGYSINGLRAASTSILLDGAENQNYFGAGVGQSVPIDSVQEYRLVTNDFTAEYGRASGGVVNLTTKSGSNQFHGTLFEYNRISALAANDFINNANNLPRGIFTRNQFGYSIGGPIIKDKLFFFSSTEWTRVRSSAATINMVPTPQFISQMPANVQQIFAANQLRFPINGTVYTVGQLEAIENVTSGPFTSLPSGMPAFGQVIFNSPTDAGGGTPQNTYSTVNRIDFNITDKTTLYGRYALQSTDVPVGANTDSPWAGYSAGANTFSQNYLINLTHTFSPTLLSQSKLTYNRLNITLPFGTANPEVPTLYLNESGGTVAGFAVALPGYNPFTPGASAVGFGGPQNVLQAAEDVSWNRSKHNFRFGGEFVYIQDNRAFNAYEEAVEALGAGSTAQGLNALLTGNLALFEVAVNPQGHFPGQQVTLPVSAPSFTRSNRYKDFALYAQDAWHVTSRLTLNLGVREEYYGVQHNVNPNLDSNFYFGSGSNIFEQIRNGSVQLAPNSPVGALWNSQPHNFAPRLGFAWDVFGNGKMSVRGGYGIAYERNYGNVTFNVIQNPPNYAVLALSGAPATVNNFGPLAGSSGTKTLPATSLRAVNPNINTAYAHLYSVAVERQLTRTTVASVEYSGSTGVNLYDISNINRAGTGLNYLGSPSHNPFTGNASSRLNGQYSNINFRSSNGSSRYNSVIFNVNSSGFRNTGLTFTANYRYSVSRDDLSNVFSGGSNAGGGALLGYTDPFNPMLDYGYSDFDIRQRFTTSLVWNIPFAKDTHGVERQVLDGWQISGIFNAHTGLPYNMYDCSTAITICHRVVPGAGSTFSTSTTGNIPTTVQGDFYNYINLGNLTAVPFTNPLTGNGEVGPFPGNMLPRNQFRGPGAWNLDLGIYKNFRISEAKSIQFRSELYNALNHANLFTVSAFTGGVGSSGEINTFNYVPAEFLGHRNVQFALKFIF